MSEHKRKLLVVDGESCTQLASEKVFLDLLALHKMLKPDASLFVNVFHVSRHAPVNLTEVLSRSYKVMNFTYAQPKTLGDARLEAFAYECKFIWHTMFYDDDDWELTLVSTREHADTICDLVSFFGGDCTVYTNLTHLPTYEHVTYKSVLDLPMRRPRDVRY